MKKLLLSLGAIAIALSASAKIDNMLDANNSTFENGQKNGWSSWGGESTSQIAEPGYNSEYCLELTNPAAGDDYYAAQAAYTFKPALETGVEYTFSFWAKSKEEGGSIQIAYQNSSDYSGGLYTQFNLTTEWKQYTKSFTISAEGMDRILINFGKVVGTFYIDDIVFGTEVEDGTGFQAPEGYVVMASGNSADGTTITEWSSKLENGQHDGRECIVYTNDTKGDSYSTQLAIDLNYAPEKMYYVVFDVMGTPSTVGISAFFQHKDGYVNLGYNDFNSVTITSDTEWTQVVLKGEYTLNEKEQLADRIAINLGEYVGTAYITGIKVYGPASDGIEAVSAETSDSVVVYNLQGIKVLEGNNAAAVNGLAKGIYIVNGKKVLVK